jgi:phage shock protein PspC (stress-responsive transcriptional regulator)
MTDQTTPPPGGAEPSQGGTTTAPPPDPAPSQTTVRPVFRRSTTDKVFSGVAGGLARTFGQDPVVVRIITVVLAIVFPPVFIAYLAAWLLVARDDEPSRPPTSGIAFRPSGGVAFWIGVVILVGALIAAFDDPFPGNFSLLPLVLVGIGIALWTRDGGSSSTTPSTAAWPQATTAQGAAMSTTTTTPSTASPTPPPAGPAGGGTPPGTPPTAQPAQPAGPVGPPPPPRPRSPLGAITIGVALIVTGLVAALDQIESLPLDADWTHLAAVALLVLGLGQLVGALWGRARWLTLVAIFLIPPVVGGAIVREVGDDWNLDAEDISIADGIGERNYRIDATDDLPGDLSLLAGSIEIDLEDWDPTPAQLAELAGDDDLEVDVGAGEVILTLPSEVPWRVVGEVGLGELTVRSEDDGVQRQSSEDLGNPLKVTRTGGPQDGDVLDVRVDVRLGELTIITPDFTPQELS